MQPSTFARSLLAVVLALLLISPPSYALRASNSLLGTPADSSEGKRSSTKAGLIIPETGLREEQKILHLLNRIGYGPRPGDVERVKEIGIAAYIEQQLDPETLPDPNMEARLADFQTLEMTSLELLAAYPPPQLLRQIERRLSAQMGMDPEAAGSLFPELERRRRRRSEQDAPQQRMSPEERMERALRSPARIVLELSQAKLLRAIYSERQLEEVMTDFWFNHFNVYIGKGADRWLTSSYEQDAIRPHALGNFRDLLGATAEHPAMLFYLDNWLSADPEATVGQRDLQRRYLAHLREQGIEPGGLLVEVLRQRGMDTTEVERVLERQLERMEEGPGRFRGRSQPGGRAQSQAQPRQRPAAGGRQQRGLNENYARELLELHTLGVDGGYTEQDIIEVARCFTGWTITPVVFGQQFIYVDELHDRGTKTVLGEKIPNRGKADGERVLDLLARHPSTARFISTKLARRFVSDTPPASLVDRMAKTFLETEGDIRSVLAALFASEEFWSPQVVNAKVKTPLEFVASAARATGAEIASLGVSHEGFGRERRDAAGRRSRDSFAPERRWGERGRRGQFGLVLALRELGQPLYACQPPTGYKDTADAWISTGGLLNRMKVALGLASSRLPGVRVELPREWAEARSAEELIREVADQTLGEPLSASTQEALVAQLNAALGESGGSGLARSTGLVLGWVLASPEFQRR